MIEIRISKIILVLCCTLMAFLPGVNNVLDYQINLAHVRHVMMMDTHVVDTFSGSFRSIESPFIHHAFYILIITAEFTIGLLGIWGSIELWKARHDADLFNRSKSKVVLSLTLGIIVWFAGFIVVGGEWFLMWLSEDWNSQQAAYRMTIPIILTLIYVSMKDDNDVVQTIT